MRYEEKELGVSRSLGYRTRRDLELQAAREAAAKARRELAERKQRREGTRGVALFAEPDGRGAR
jgi:hypothetical protein